MFVTYDPDYVANGGEREEGVIVVADSATINHANGHADYLNSEGPLVIEHCHYSEAGHFKNSAHAERRKQRAMEEYDDREFIVLEFLPKKG
jgi:hypothetical protein